MMKVLKILFWIIWITIGLFCHIGFIGVLDMGEIGTITMGAVFALLWWAITIIVIKNKGLKKENKSLKEQALYVTNLEYNSDKFGKIMLKKDIRKHSITGEIPNVKFGNKMLEASIRVDDTADISKILNNLGKVSDKSNEIKERFYVEFAKENATADNIDENGNLFELTEQFLREKFNFNFIWIEDEEQIGIWGNWEESGNQDYSINYDCVTGKMEYELL